MSTNVRTGEGQPGEPPVRLLQDPRTLQAREHQEAGLVARLQSGQPLACAHAKVRQSSYTRETYQFQRK
tara:strand:+ start:169 stop:375 length:207 start_codon:yes stop_codon:yes gene_type:complete